MVSSSSISLLYFGLQALQLLRKKNRGTVCLTQVKQTLGGTSLIGLIRQKSYSQAAIAPDAALAAKPCKLSLFVLSQDVKRFCKRGTALADCSFGHLPSRQTKCGSTVEPALQYPYKEHAQPCL